MVSLLRKVRVGSVFVLRRLKWIRVRLRVLVIGVKSVKRSMMSVSIMLV